MGRNAYVYFICNSTNDVLYLGVTNNLERRILEHKNQANSGFATKYQCFKLVYFEHTSSIRAAIEREKQLKNWKREWKNVLIEKQNPQWIDLSLQWLTKEDCGSEPAMTSL